MTPPQQRVDELFAQAIELPPDARAQFLVEACGLDSELRAEVLSLIEHDERATPDFLAPPSLPPCQGGIEGGPDPLIGTRLGKYTILRVIAGGGMGRVYEAEQDNPKRTVALKVVPTWAWSRVGRRRFEFEVEALARLTHPNIAQIFDAGTIDPDPSRNREGAEKGATAVSAVGSSNDSHDQSRERQRPDDQSRRRQPTDILPNDPSTSDKPVTGLAPDALTHGIPYFVMEFVPNAMPITGYVDRHELTVRQRLELFLQLCDAVHYGHQKGIIHRDLKPGNILVGEDRAYPSVERERHDQSPVQTTNPLPAGRGSDQAANFPVSPFIKGGPRGVAPSSLRGSVASSLPLVKVIDFGIAKAIDSDVAVTTMHTEVGQLIGTLQYMSPEQCAADPLGLDVRSDVYSLGVVAYQLLCGRLPYGVATKPRSHEATKEDAETPKSRNAEGTPLASPLAKGGFEGGYASPLSMLRTICEVPPIRPSTIHRALRGDLEIVLLKALEKDRQKRYQSAADLARDLRHYLAREPIEARGPSLAASAFLWIRRHPILTTAFAAGTIGITILATAWTTVYLAHLRPYRIEARDDAREAVLLSYNGNVLHTWNSLGRNTIKPATIVSLSDETPNSLAIIGFPQTHPGPFRGRLCAFDINAGNYDTPMWTSRIEPQDVPTVEPEEGFAAEDFCPELLFGPFDVFPDFPGKELIATFCHSRSRHAIRVLSSNGEVLFQIWHDGTVPSAYWLSDAKLLVFTGTNDEGPWTDRGIPGNERQYYPWVVWAVRPVLGQRESRYVCTGWFKDCIAPAWYKCVMPFGLTDAFREATVGPPPNAGLEDGEHFLLGMIYETASLQRQELMAGWVVDADGKKAQGPFHKNDAYLQIEAERKVAPIERFFLDNLPPIIRPPTTE